MEFVWPNSHERTTGGVSASRTETAKLFDMDRREGSGQEKRFCLARAPTVFVLYLCAVVHERVDPPAGGTNTLGFVRKVVLGCWLTESRNHDLGKAAIFSRVQQVGRNKRSAVPAHADISDNLLPELRCACSGLQ